MYTYQLFEITVGINNTKVMMFRTLLLYHIYVLFTSHQFHTENNTYEQRNVKTRTYESNTK